MHFVLADVNEAIVRAWREYCGDLDGLSIYHGSILEVPCDAIVSPANSFGFMDGGLDLKLSQFLGWHVQERLQELIRTRHYGELLVGTAEIVPTDHPRIPYLISAPTMRVPMTLGRDTVNVYLATRAVLILLLHGTLPGGTPVKEVVKTVAIPGMGTGTGRVPPEICAWQMRCAFREVLQGDYHFPRSWKEAKNRHQSLLHPLKMPKEKEG